MPPGVLHFQLGQDDRGHLSLWILAKVPSRSGITRLFQGPPWVRHKPDLGWWGDRPAPPQHTDSVLCLASWGDPASHTGTHLSAHSPTQQTLTNGCSCQTPQTAHSCPRAAPGLQAEGSHPIPCVSTSSSALPGAFCHLPLTGLKAPPELRPGEYLVTAEAQLM